MTRRYPVRSIEVQPGIGGARIVLEWVGDADAALAAVMRSEGSDPGALAELAQTILAEALDQVRHALAHADVQLERPPTGDA